MKSKYVLLCILFLILCFSVYFLFDAFEKNSVLNDKYNDVKGIVSQNEIDRKIYLEKEKELEELKKKNSDKITKYEEVKKWNEEIIQYLD